MPQYCLFFLPEAVLNRQCGDQKVATSIKNKLMLENTYDHLSKIAKKIILAVKLMLIILYSSSIFKRFDSSIKIFFQSMGNLSSCILPYCRCPAYARRVICPLAQNRNDRSFEKKNTKIMDLLNFFWQKLTSFLTAILVVMFVRIVVKKGRHHGAYIIHLDTVAFHLKCY